MILVSPQWPWSSWDYLSQSSPTLHSTEKDLAQYFSYPAEKPAVEHPGPEIRVVVLNSVSTGCCWRLRSSAAIRGASAAAPAAVERRGHLSQQVTLDACLLCSVSFWGGLFPALQIFWTWQMNPPTVSFLLSLWFVLWVTISLQLLLTQLSTLPPHSNQTLPHGIPEAHPTLLSRTVLLSLQLGSSYKSLFNVLLCHSTSSDLWRDTFFFFLASSLQKSC